MATTKWFTKQQLIDHGVIDISPVGDKIMIATGKVNKSHDAQNGYRNFIWRFNKNTYIISAHRAVYLWFNDSIPENYHVDHIDHDGWNNRIENLQVLPATLNIRNQRPRG